jgi:hypothetical protein
MFTQVVVEVITQSGDAKEIPTLKPESEISLV